MAWLSYASVAAAVLLLSLYFSNDQLQPYLGAYLSGFRAVAPAVDLGYSTYEGVFNQASNTTAFLGIRYAAPPLGNLRFAAPQPPHTTSKAIKADTPGAQCFQAAFGKASYYDPSFNASTYPKTTFRWPVSEDCLFLDVYVPGKPDPTRKLPVIFYIHGGGYVFGGLQGLGDLAGPSNGEELIRASKNGVIYVQLQYRLGLFGFLAGKKVKERGALNAGMLDQDFALKWVQEHIHKFGGDKDRVTIWGTSAGAGSVVQHLIANNGKTSPPLFHSAITSSFYLPAQYPYDHSIPEQIYDGIVQRSNCATSPDSFACLQNADVNILDSINQALVSSGFFGTTTFSPVVDGTFITQRPTQAFRQAKFNGKALYVVTNTNEGIMLVNPGLDDSADVGEYIHAFLPSLEAKHVGAAVKLYANAEIGSVKQQLDAIMGEVTFVCPSYFLAQRFRASAPFKAEFGAGRAWHADDVPYYFPTTQLEGGMAIQFNNTDYSNAFVTSFTSFAISHDPSTQWKADVELSNRLNLPEWKAWRVRSPDEVVFGTREGREIGEYEPAIVRKRTPAGLLKRCAFWESVASQTYQ